MLQPSTGKLDDVTELYNMFAAQWIYLRIRTLKAAHLYRYTATKFRLKGVFMNLNSMQKHMHQTF